MLNQKPHNQNQSGRLWCVPAPETKKEEGTTGCTGIEAIGAIQWEMFWKATEPKVDEQGNL